MPGLAGAWCGPKQYSTAQDLIATTDLLGASKVESLALERGFIGATHLDGSPLTGSRCFEDDGYVAAFAGDLVDVDAIPWDKILGTIRSGSYTYLSELRGNFAIAVHDKQADKLFLVTDQRGQQPLNYTLVDDGIIFSTQMSTFCRLARVPSLSRRWLYQMMYFNWPMWQTTFLDGVYAVPPASVVVYDAGTRKISISPYAEPFSKSQTLLTGDAALEKAYSVLSTRAAKYFEGGDGDILLGLSGGWDSRAILSLCPRHLVDRVVIYTYGVKGNDDLIEASKVAEALGLRHIKIHFDEKFLDEMPQLMAQAVYASSAAQSILRAPQPYIFRILAQSVSPLPIHITGISMDASFKGYANVPVVFSPDLDRTFTEGKPVIRPELFQDMFDADYSDFTAQVKSDLEAMKAKYGDFRSSECHLSYLVYDACPRFFLGEMELANQFSTFRVPCWDDDIVRLAYQIEYSRLKFSYYLGSPDPGEHNRLHTYVLRRNPGFAKLPTAGFPLSLWWRGTTAVNLYRALVRAPRKLLSGGRKPKVPLADWKAWINTAAKTVTDNLVFSSGSLIRDHLGRAYLEKERQKETRSSYWMGKLLTFEIMLRQMKTGWRKPIP
jgi:asparagine synthetase B (glutamine-hydrolysing)